MNGLAYPLAKGPLSTFGEPVFRISHTVNGVRSVMLLAAPHRHQARMNAQTLGLKQIVVGKWRGRTPLTPTPWIMRTPVTESVIDRLPSRT